MCGNLEIRRELKKFASDIENESRQKEPDKGRNNHFSRYGVAYPD
ncbi:Uncharacterised protein [Legionella jordanis]|nr:Uncharacterised protein [Legionella jordanis]